MNETSSNLTIKEKCYKMDVYIDPYNKRLRIDDYSGCVSDICEKAEMLAKQYKAEKLIIKARKEHYFQFLEKCFQSEGVIDGYFLGSDCYFFCKYYEAERKSNTHWITEDEIIGNVQNLEKSTEVITPPSDYQLKKIEKKDAPKLASLYKEVFQIYPTPLHNPDYIIKTIDEGTIYYSYQVGDQIVSAASAEVNHFYKNAELTDCATLPQHRKHGLMKIILEQLENELLQHSIFCSYSLARSLSFGMNAVLHQLGYSYRGRLMNNCYIYDKLEDMNVWVKDLAKN